MSELRWRRAHVAAATLVGAVSGVAFGIALAPADSPAPTHDSGPRVGLASGAARLPLPDGWEPLGRRSSLPGLRSATAVRGIDSDVALDIRAPEDPSLLAADVIAASGDEPPRPQLQRLGGRAVWRYELPGGEPSLRMVALTLPTTEGVVTIACEAATVALAGDDCERAMSVLRVSGASELAPAPETAARIALPAALARLNGERRKHRRALAATRSAPERSRTAGRLARAYRTAAARLRPLAAGDARRLADALARLAHDHRSLARASRRRDAAAAGRAGSAIERGEQRVAAQLQAVSRASGAARDD